MAQLKPCESREEFMNAWKARLLVDGAGIPLVPIADYIRTFGEVYLSLVNKEGVQLCNYDDYIRQVDRFITKGRLWDYDKDRLFILVEDEED